MKRRKIVKAIWMVMGIYCGLMGMHQSILHARAAEKRDTEMGQVMEEMDIRELSQVMTAGEAVDMKAAPSKSAETIMSYGKGASVFVTGQTYDGWYRVIYQDKEGYIPKDLLYEQEIDVAGLDAEMAQAEQEAKFIMESVEKYREETKHSRIWGGVIIALVVGIFAMGVLSGQRSKKPENHS